MDSIKEHKTSKRYVRNLRTQSRPLGWAFALILLAQFTATTALIVALGRLNLLQTWQYNLTLVILYILFAINLILLFRVKARVGKIIAVVLAIIITIVCAFGYKYVRQTVTFVEQITGGEYAGADDIFLSPIQAGYKVFLAHPEHYQSSHKNIDHLLELHGMGALFQCNLGSIIGQYGKNAQKTLKKLAKADLIFCFGTDIHHTRDYSEIAKVQKQLRKYYSADQLQAVLETNARKILCS